MKDKSITIVGAGLVGSLLSILLAKRGFEVHVFEKRQDLRENKASAGKSINLALANRGIYALKQAGIEDEVQKILIPMLGRMLHDTQGALSFQKYGQKDHEKIYSISRRDLNELLLNEAQSTGRVRFYFNHSFETVCFKDRTITLKDQVTDQVKTINYHKLIGSDGSYSKLRKEILRQKTIQDSEELLDHSYKELHIPPKADKQFAMEAHALHIWPRDEFMQIALPNLDGSFTVTLFLPNEGPISFESLQEKHQVVDFYQRYFGDSLSLIPNYSEDFFNNPTGKLSTIKCSPWSYGDSVLLLGDAAHGIVPFHGQGMNCGFEDCSEFLRIFDQSSSWEEFMKDFEDARKPNCDAIADLAIENYLEMRSKVKDKRFQIKKDLAFSFERRFPEVFIPRYSMVMFHRLPYSEAKMRGEIQNGILNECVSDLEARGDIDYEKVKQLIDQRLTPLDSAYHI